VACVTHTAGGCDRRGPDAAAWRWFAGLSARSGRTELGGAMASTGFLGARSPSRRGDPMSQMDAEDLIEFLLKSNKDMVDAAREWEESALREQQKAGAEIEALRRRCADYEAILAENERGLQHELAKSSRDVQHLTEALREEASMSSDEIEHLRLQLVQLRTERDHALSRAKAAEKAGNDNANEVGVLREQLAAARDAKGVSLHDYQEMQEELDTARKERSATEKQLETLKKHHEHTAAYKRQTVMYLKRYETQIAGLERNQKALLKENAELRRAPQNVGRMSREMTTQQHVVTTDASDFQKSEVDAQAAATAADAAAKVRTKALSAKFTPPSTPTNGDSSGPSGQVSTDTYVGTLRSDVFASSDKEDDIARSAASLSRDLAADSSPNLPAPGDRQLSSARVTETDREIFSTPSHGPVGGSDTESDSAAGSPERAAAVSTPVGDHAVEGALHRIATGFSDASSIVSTESTGASTVTDGSNW
jgi:chromosome segregation ATPase